MNHKQKLTILIFLLLSSKIFAHSLYPSIIPYNNGMLQVSERHSIYWEESGNPDGVPALFLHGGPGVRTDENQRKFFDPSFYRIILFDQRGCGKSTPLGCLEENTTWDLVEDIDKLLTYLTVEKCLLFGGSWGSTLALTYAIEHPEKILGMILRGIFLCQQEELDWFYQEGASQLAPEAWQILLNALPEDNRSDLLTAYHYALHSPNYWERTYAAAAWVLWELAHLHREPDSRLETLIRHPILFYLFALLYATQNHIQASIENHYFLHRSFFPTDRWILEHCDQLNAIPTIIIQGECDQICPWKYAAELHANLPQSIFILLSETGHASSELKTIKALVEATETFKSIFNSNVD
jgi:proline iminopeptidase